MNDMTPAPISVERLSPAISDYPGNHFEDAEPIMVATLDGEYVRHSDYAALLHQLAEAERAKEEFRLLASLRLFHAPTIGYCWFERCGVSWTGKAHATINEANAEKTAAFLAASGGDRP